MRSMSPPISITLTSPRNRVSQSTLQARRFYIARIAVLSEFAVLLLMVAEQIGIRLVKTLEQVFPQRIQNWNLCQLLLGSHRVLLSDGMRRKAGDLRRRSNRDVALAHSFQQHHAEKRRLNVGTSSDGAMVRQQHHGFLAQRLGKWAHAVF